MSHFQKVFEGTAIGIHRIAITLQYYMYFLSHSWIVRRGEGRSPVGALPPYLPTQRYTLISYTQHLPSLPQANVSAPRLVSNCPITLGSLSGSMYSLTTIYFFIPCLFKSYLLGCQVLAPHRCPTNFGNASVLFWWKPPPLLIAPSS